MLSAEELLLRFCEFLEAANLVVSVEESGDERSWDDLIHDFFAGGGDWLW